MNIKFLGQGYETASENAVGKYLIKFLSEDFFHTFTGFSAFLSVAGLDAISNFIEQAKTNSKSLNLIVGVDEGGTPQDALKRLHDLYINGYIFYQRESPIFHPKIYLFEGENQTKLIVGSSNLTLKGLFTNVESSLLVEFSADDEDGQKLLSELKSYFQPIFEFNDPNLFRVTPEKINEFVAEGIVLAQAARPKKDSKSGADKKDSVILDVPKRATAKVPRSVFRGKSTVNEIVPQVIEEIEFDFGDLVWTRRSLPASSVQQSGSNTNPTGGLRLVQDKFTVAGSVINQTTYFRNHVFSNCNWTQVRDNPIVETATVKFDVTIKGEHLGVHDLEVRHKLSGEAGQGNYTTSISWGTLSAAVAAANLENRRLDLYAPAENSDVFGIIIS